MKTGLVVRLTSAVQFAALIAALSSCSNSSVTSSSLPVPVAKIGQIPKAVKGSSPLQIDYSSEVVAQKQVVSVELQYSLDKSSYTSIATLPGNTQSYTWNVPGQNATGATLRMIAKDSRGLTTQVTSSPFKILASISNFSVDQAQITSTLNSVNFGGTCDPSDTYRIFGGITPATSPLVLAHYQALVAPDCVPDGTGNGRWSLIINEPTLINSFSYTLQANDIVGNTAQLNFVWNRTCAALNQYPGFFIGLGNDGSSLTCQPTVCGPGLNQTTAESPQCSGIGTLTQTCAKDGSGWSQSPATGSSCGCDPGAFTPDGGASCRACDAGAYSPLANATSCAACPTGSWSSAGSKTCSACVDQFPNLLGNVSYTSSGNAPNNNANGVTVSSCSATFTCQADYFPDYNAKTCTSCGSSGWFALNAKSQNDCQKCSNTLPNEFGSPQYSSNGKGSNACVISSAGFSCSPGFGLVSATQCDSGCAVGWASTGQAACHQCGVDQFAQAKSSSCGQCTTGQYSVPGSGSCSSCVDTIPHSVAHTYGTSGNGAANGCQLNSLTCAPNFAPNAGAKTCTACGVNAQSDGTGACSCSAGWTTVTGGAPDANGCTVCASGYLAVNGSCAKILNCGADSYPDYAAGKCTSCGTTGWFASNAKSKADCQQCTNTIANEVGTPTYAGNGNGANACAISSSGFNCGAGFASNGQASCQQCGIDQFAPAQSVSCNQCTAGQFSIAGSGSCSSCVDNISNSVSHTYRSSGNGVATGCQLGSLTCATNFAPNLNSKSCNACGVNAQSNGSSACSCSAGWTTASGAAPDATGCTVCASGYTSFNGSCYKTLNCGADTYPDYLAGKCTSCASPGFYAAAGAKDSSACKACTNTAPNEFGTPTYSGNGGGSNACAISPNGFSCSAGYASNGQTSCQQCGVDQFAPAQSASCSACPVGQFSVAGSAACSSCADTIQNSLPGFTYSSSGKGAANGCSLTPGSLKCVAGFTPNASAKTCTACGVNAQSDGTGACSCSAGWTTASGNAPDASGCTVCTSGYTAFNGSCYKTLNCGVDTYPDYASGTCASCGASGFFAAAGSKDKSACQKCSNTLANESGTPNYTSNGNGSNACAISSSGFSCSSGYGVSSSGNQCTACGKNASSNGSSACACNSGWATASGNASDGVDCSVCASGYTLANGSCTKTLNCGVDTYPDYVSGTCTACAATGAYALAGQTSASGCRSCTNTAPNESGTPTYSSNGGGSNACAISSIGFSCSSGFGVSSTGNQCTACGKNASSNGSSACACNSGWATASGNASDGVDCSVCATGLKLVNGSCVVPPPPPTSTPSCQQCPVGYTLSNGSCTAQGSITTDPNSGTCSVPLACSCANSGYLYGHEGTGSEDWTSSCTATGSTTNGKPDYLCQFNSPIALASVTCRGGKCFPLSASQSFGGCSTNQISCQGSTGCAVALNNKVSCPQGGTPPSSGTLCTAQPTTVNNYCPSGSSFDAASNTCFKNANANVVVTGFTCDNNSNDCTSTNDQGVSQPIAVHGTGCTQTSCGVEAFQNSIQCSNNWCSFNYQYKIGKTTINCVSGSGCTLIPVPGPTTYSCDDPSYNLGSDHVCRWTPPSTCPASQSTGSTGRGGSGGSGSSSSGNNSSTTTSGTGSGGTTSSGTTASGTTSSSGGSYGGSGGGGSGSTSGPIDCGGFTSYTGYCTPGNNPASQLTQ